MTAAKTFYTRMWDSLRRAATIADGDAVLAMWRAEISGPGTLAVPWASGVDPSAPAAQKVVALRKILGSWLTRNGDPTSAAEYEYMSRPGGWLGGSLPSHVRDQYEYYAYLQSIIGEYAEARAWWAQRVAAFAAAATRDLGEVVQGVTVQVSTAADGVREVAGVVMSIVDAGGLTDAAAAEARARLSRVIASMDGVLDELGSALDRIQYVVAHVDAGDVDAFVPLDTQTSIPTAAKVAGVALGALLVRRLLV